LSLQRPAIGDDVENAVFLVLFRPGPKWMNDRTVFAQPLQPHAKYMQQLYDAGKLILAGPFLDNSGGMAVVSVSSDEDLREILASEPAIGEGIFVAETHPWYLLFDAKRGRSLSDRSRNSSSPGLEADRTCLRSHETNRRTDVTEIPRSTSCFGRTQCMLCLHQLWSK
jgi:uncharacterized protein YciI